MNEAEQRFTQDINQANITYPDAIGLIMSGAESWSEQTKLIRAEKYQEALDIVENNISEIEEYLAEFPNAKEVLGFTLARAYLHKGACLGGIGHYSKNIVLVKQGLQWVDKGLALTNWPPELKAIQYKIRDVLLKDIQKMEGNPSATNDRNNTSATPNTKSFNEVSVICPTCGQKSTIKWREEKCASGAGACAFNMDKFESGEGLFCVVCGTGFYANTDNKGKGVLRCHARITASGPSGSMSVDCRAPIPATPSCVTPIIKEKKKSWWW